MKTVLYRAADLLWATRIKETAFAVGVEARPARTPRMLRDRLADSDVAAILLDLDAPEEALELIGVLRDESAGPEGRSVRVVCWGPHVETELLRHAREHGADEVMTRGAFSQKLPELLKTLSGSES